MRVKIISAARCRPQNVYINTRTFRLHPCETWRCKAKTCSQSIVTQSWRESITRYFLAEISRCLAWFHCLRFWEKHSRNYLLRVARRFLIVSQGAVSRCSHSQRGNFSYFQSVPRLANVCKQTNPQHLRVSSFCSNSVPSMFKLDIAWRRFNFHVKISVEATWACWYKTTVHCKQSAQRNGATFVWW